MNNYLGMGGFGESISTFKQNKYPSYTVNYSDNITNVNYSASIYWGKGWDVTITSGNPYTMQASLNVELQSDGITPVTAAGTYVTVNWGLHYNVTQTELLSCTPNILPWITGVTAAEKTIIENKISNPSATGDTTWTSSLGSSASQTVYNMYLVGQKTIPVYQQVLTKRSIVPSTYDLTPFITNVGSYYAKSSLASAIGIPTNWQNSMWTAPSDPSSTTTYNITYYYGWLKQAPTMDQNGSSITINQEWWYGLYPSNTYGSRL
jgi:hypothetical protein